MKHWWSFGSQVKAKGTKSSANLSFVLQDEMQLYTAAHTKASLEQFEWLATRTWKPIWIELSWMEIPLWSSSLTRGGKSWCHAWILLVTMQICILLYASSDFLSLIFGGWFWNSQDQNKKHLMESKPPLVYAAQNAVNYKIISTNWPVYLPEFFLPNSRTCNPNMASLWEQ